MSIPVISASKTVSIATASVISIHDNDDGHMPSIQLDCTDRVVTPPLRSPISPTTSVLPKSCLKKAQPVAIQPLSPGHSQLTAPVLSPTSALLSPSSQVPDGDLAQQARAQSPASFSLYRYLSPSPTPSNRAIAVASGSGTGSTGESLIQGPHPSLHIPLKFHLRFLHPSTPIPILSFVAKRLLSTDRPYGHTGEWKPIWDGYGDLSTAGVGADAGPGCEQKEGGKGKELDRRLEEMYRVARESYRALEAKSPQGGRV